jgi:hypothetical protein
MSVHPNVGSVVNPDIIQITMLTYITIRHRAVTVLHGYESGWQRPSRV